jgi:hypothetical protein
LSQINRCANVAGAVIDLDPVNRAERTVGMTEVTTVSFAGQAFSTSCLATVSVPMAGAKSAVTPVAIDAAPDHGWPELAVAMLPPASRWTSSVRPLMMSSAAS